MYRDPTTSSNYDEITVTHYFLEWTVCFLQKNIYGCIEMTLKALKDVDKIVLDGDKLAISSVNLNGQDLEFTVEPGTPIGDKIIIKSPISEGQEVAVPGDLVCLMSAICKGKKKSGDTTTYTFDQPVAIPSYLLAIVVGHIERREISPRCDVWCEPSLVDAAKWEFESTEKILQTAEKIAGPYRWGRYDLVVLPPTFPFGGMENPCLTFITPTLLVWFLCLLIDLYL
ncbi:peptidase family M1, partial [Teladorsagia circumcincta]